MKRSDSPIKIEDGPDTDVLVVEGEDDFFTIKNLFIRHGLLGKIRLESAGGYSRLAASIDSRVDESNLRRFGVIVDADEDSVARWESIRSAFDLAGTSSHHRRKRRARSLPYRGARRSAFG